MSETKPSLAVSVEGVVDLAKECANAAGDWVWATALTLPDGRVLDLGTLLDSVPRGERDGLDGAHVRIEVVHLAQGREHER